MAILTAAHTSFTNASKAVPIWLYLSSAYCVTCSTNIFTPVEHCSDVVDPRESYSWRECQARKNGIRKNLFMFRLCFALVRDSKTWGKWDVYDLRSMSMSIDDDGICLRFILNGYWRTPLHYVRLRTAYTVCGELNSSSAPTKRVHSDNFQIFSLNLCWSGERTSDHVRVVCSPHSHSKLLLPCSRFGKLLIFFYDGLWLSPLKVGPTHLLYRQHSRWQLETVA